MDTPNFLVAEIKSDNGQMLAALPVMPKQFSTGSLGYYANQKIEIGGKRYQVQVQLVEIGSKKAKEKESEGE
jgi:hypothetical protein